VELPHRHIRRADQTSQPAAELDVEKVYFVGEPLWYLRLAGHARLTWRRELTSVATVFALGVALGFLVGRL
jgi:hypothetical protein